METLIFLSLYIPGAITTFLVGRKLLKPRDTVAPVLRAAQFAMFSWLGLLAVILLARNLKKEEDNPGIVNPNSKWKGSLSVAAFIAIWVGFVVVLAHIPPQN